LKVKKQRRKKEKENKGETLFSFFINKTTHRALFSYRESLLNNLLVDIIGGYLR
jgi:hypothetical protein